MITPLEHHLLKTYLNREMDAPAEEAFEMLMLDRPDLAEFVMADVALASGLVRSRTDLHAHPVAQGERSARPRRVPKLGIAVAAGALLAVGAGIGRWWPATPASSLTPATMFYVDAVRGTNDVPHLTLPQTGTVVAVLPVIHAGCAPDIEVEQGGIVSRIHSAQDSSGYASVVLDHGVLQPGPAAFRVLCSGQSPATYRVEALR